MLTAGAAACATGAGSVGAVVGIAGDAAPQAERAALQTQTASMMSAFMESPLGADSSYTLRTTSEP
jgi:hypothetical protein